MGEVETESEMTRTEVATYLRELADGLDGGAALELELGGRQVRLDPEDPITLKMEGESDWSSGETEAKQSIEFELVWWTPAETAQEGELDVEPTGN